MDPLEVGSFCRLLVGTVRQFSSQIPSFCDEEMIQPPHHLCLMHNCVLTGDTVKSVEFVEFSTV